MKESTEEKVLTASQRKSLVRRRNMMGQGTTMGPMMLWNAALFIFPLIYLIVLSFATNSGFGKMTYGLSFENFKAVLRHLSDRSFQFVENGILGNDSCIGICLSICLLCGKKAKEISKFIDPFDHDSILDQLAPQSVRHPESYVYQRNHQYNPCKSSHSK